MTWNDLLESRVKCRHVWLGLIIIAWKRQVRLFRTFFSYLQRISRYKSCWIQSKPAPIIMKIVSTFLLLFYYFLLKILLRQIRFRWYCERHKSYSNIHCCLREQNKIICFKYWITIIKKVFIFRWKKNFTFSLL